MQVQECWVSIVTGPCFVGFPHGRRKENLNHDSDWAYRMSCDSSVPTGTLILKSVGDIPGWTLVTKNVLEGPLSKW
jgi:hypothetical protein